ncbi:MAG: DNA repair exonuclease [Blautia sp.]|nr:DNA repair exonuclease [Blautia sp.]
MRFIHLADVHLGAVPDRGYPWSARRQEEIWDTFRQVIATIREESVDFLLIAGDLFHGQPLLQELREVSALFEQIPQTRVFVMAGNHDYLKEDSAYRRFTWPDNVYFFSGEKPERVKDPLLPVYIYGLSYEHQEITQALYEELVPWSDQEEFQIKEEDQEPFEEFHILLAHGGDARHIPIDLRAISRSGFDYIALGHIHKPQILIRDRAAYSGALEPLDRNDTGEHGYIVGWTQKGILRTRFVPAARRSYVDLVVDVTPEDTQVSLEEQVQTRVRSEGAGNIYRIILNGFRAPEQMFIPERLKRLGNVLEIQDNTKPHYELKELYNAYRSTLIGDYIASFFPEAIGRSDDWDPVEEKALFYGLQALLETH